jgi:mRNA interferase RelE/StbE
MEVGAKPVPAEQVWADSASGRDVPPVRAGVRPESLAGARKLDRPVVERIKAATDSLREDSRPAGAKMLTGMHGVLRIRVAGEYRVLYTIDDDRLVVLVVDAGHRRRIYRQRLGRRVRTDTWPRSRGDATRWPDGCEIYQRRLFRSGCHNHAFHP